MAQYRVKLSGYPLPGHTTESIAEALKQQMGLGPAQVRALLPPAKRVVKAGLDAQEAERWHQALTRAGLAASKEAQAAPAAAPAKPGDPLESLRSCLAQGFSRRRPSPLYSMHLSVVTICCVLMPLLYLALVTGLGYALYWYLGHAHLLIGRRVHGIWPLLLVYGVPGVSGGILLLFLARPILAGGSGRDRSLTLDPADEPRLTEAIQVLTGAIGIRPPVALKMSNQVNASVHFEGGWPGFFSGRKVLTIGLPLVAGLTSQQFLGVLAHEFGHFAQRFGMRCSFLVNHVNAWLDVRAHQPDPWDERLQRWAEESGDTVIRIVVFITQLGIRASRMLLHGLFLLSFRLSRSLSRQMEFDADRYEVMLAGSENFRETALRLRALSQAFGEIDEQNARTWREHKLLRNIPQAAAAHVATFDTQAWAKLKRSLGYGTTRYWDTHPADLERIRSAQDLQAAGLFHDDRPATTLFEHFAEHCENATRAYYRQLGVDYQTAELCDSQTVTSIHSQRTTAVDDLRRWSGRQWRSLPWLPLQLALPDAQAQLSWQACIDELRQDSPAIARDWEAAEQENKRRMRLAFSGTLDRHDIPSHLNRVEAFDEERHLPEYQRIAEWKTPARQSLIRVAGLYRRRIEHTLGRERLVAELVFALSPLYNDIECLQEAWFVASRFPDSRDPAQHAWLSRFRHDADVACQDYAMHLLRKCDGIPQTLLEGGSVGGYLRKRCPRLDHSSASPREFAGSAGLLLDGLNYAYQAALAELAQRCAEVERSRGITGIDG
ncbi:peptidase [Rhodanobacter thiooxydans]|uniref:Peptidase n=1 Tax=Rhodanobacter thiooxydans TaxID=416169 RepID=A0A154QDY5_9GAMM|nr:M48 family metallopeptidase [Rhodanobacter thiooxydans]EIL99448.1 Zn-dependent protease with chaperone function [Rhodanobacter thiooxydans LCS2]KZC22464.1 peptidase [Rhodanobacter thiooxydans]MCW0201941.1 M48 family metalloprotease [Rhodanobacter thiooxydans]